MARGRTEEWNRELANIVSQKLKARREKLEQAGAISLGFLLAGRSAAGMTKLLQQIRAALRA